LKNEEETIDDIVSEILQEELPQVLGVLQSFNQLQFMEDQNGLQDPSLRQE
jgi:hypothetical protein